MNKSQRKIFAKAIYLISQGSEMLEEVQYSEQNDFDSMAEKDQEGSKGSETQEIIDAVSSAVEALQDIQSDLESYLEIPAQGVQIAAKV